MGYAMSKYELDIRMCGEESNSGVCLSKNQHEESLNRDCEIRQLINLRTKPSAIIHKAAGAEKDVPVSTVKMLLAREANFSGRGKFSSADQCHVLNRCLPVNGPWCVDSMTSRAYVSQFSTDGSLFVAGFQGSHLRVYDVEDGWKVKKNITARSLRWTITDTSLSPNQHYLVYASMSPIVHIVNVGGGASESHANITSDVNTVAFADETGHLIYSGSDDNLCKVWDRRCFTDRGRPAGTLVGHLEGITFIDSRGDGRYFISNGKDQTTKLWDIRKMSSNVNFSTPETCHWDYRWMEYPLRAKQVRHPSDQLLATYKGHSVLRTLIRCYFSPNYSTGQKYIYTGSSDECVYIYDVVSGNQVGKLKYHDSIVRDCSWHPYYPMLISSGWDGLIARWEFSGSSDEPALIRRRARRKHIY